MNPKTALSLFLVASAASAQTPPPSSSIENDTAEAAVSADAATEATCLPVTTVDNFNITAYAQAPWYVQQQAENAYTPLDQNRCVTAQYAQRETSRPAWYDLPVWLIDPGNWWGYTIDVFNYADVTSDDGGDFSSMGGNLCAAQDADTPSQLSVAPCWLPPLFAGPYWIVAYQEDPTDGYALVSGGQPTQVVDGESDCGPDGTNACCKTGDGINRSGLWILTRQKNPSATLVETVRGLAKQAGFATSVLFDVTHDENCRVPGIDDSDNGVADEEQAGEGMRYLRRKSGQC